MAPQIKNARASASSARISRALPSSLSPARTRTHTHARMADDSSRKEGEANVSSSHLSEAPLVELPKALSRLRGKDVWAKTSAVVCVLRRPG